MNSFKNKTVVITGGSQGIGLAISEAFAKEGAKVIILNRNTDKGKHAVEKITANGGIAEAIKFDISDTSSIKKVIKSIISQHEKIDILVNNAAIHIQKDIESVSELDWDTTFNTNLKGAFFISQAVLPSMKSHQNGKIIFISSVADRKPFPGVSIYSASKAGVTMLAKSMSTEYAQYGININTICPGNVATSMNTHLQDNKEFVEWIKARTPTKRAYLSTQEIADVTLFLGSDKASAIHGADIPVDDGWLIGG